MKWVAALRSYTGNDPVTNIRFPCPGYLSNISVKIHKTLTSSGWQLVFGDVDVESLVTKTPLVDGAGQWHPGRSSDILMIQDFDYDFADDAGNWLYYHGKSKKMRIRSDKVYSLGFFGKDTSTTAIAIIEAEFTPYENGYYKMQYSYDQLSIASNFNTRGISIPTSLRDVMLEFTVHATAENTGTPVEAGVIIQPHLLKRGRTLYGAGADNIEGYGTFDNLTMTGDVRAPGPIDTMTVTTSAAGAGFSRGVVAVRQKVGKGDKITFDMENFTAESLDTLQVVLTVHGKIDRPDRNNYKSLFYDGTQYILPLEEVAI